MYEAMEIICVALMAAPLMAIVVYAMIAIIIACFSSGR